MIYKKHKQWCFKNDEGVQHFDTEEAAIKAYGFPMPQAELEPLSSWSEDLDHAEEEEG
jgi:hypothetical protein